MDNRRLILEELNKTIRLIKKRIDYEYWFSGMITGRKKDADNKASRVELLYEQVKSCRLCGLYKTRKNIVFGSGNLEAKLVFVGEAPGRDEDLAGMPFVGAAGQLLTKIIAAMELKREDVYITNVLRCRPPNNRDPLPEEVVCCRKYLVELLKIIQPKIICTLGKFAAGALIDGPVSITRVRGKYFEFEGIKFLPTFHPAYLLRNPGDKKLVWQDMQKIMDFLKE